MFGRLFKKNKSVTPDPLPATLSVICIPGNWVDWNAFILGIVATSAGEYLAGGNLLMNVKNNKHFTVEFCGWDGGMQDAFRAAGLVTQVSEEFLAEIGRHQHVIYISGATGNLQDAMHLAFAAEAVLRAGGTGVKVESAGKAFEKKQWQGLLQDFEPANLYELYVVDSITTPDDTVYSCGMHNLGYRDTIVSGMPFQEAVGLIRIFGYYQLIDKPAISAGQTFQPMPEAPLYQIMDEPIQPASGFGLFENPYGIWRLSQFSKKD